MDEEEGGKAVCAQSEWSWREVEAYGGPTAWYDVKSIEILEDNDPLFVMRLVFVTDLDPRPRSFQCDSVYLHKILDAASFYEYLRGKKRGDVSAKWIRAIENCLDLIADEDVNERLQELKPPKLTWEEMLARETQP